MTYPSESIAKITLASPTGTFDFSPDIPLVGRQVRSIRQDEEGESYRTVVMSLSGFFTGNAHHEVVAQYQSLKAVLDADEVVLSYHDGDNQIVSGTAYIESVNEPTDWKQYDGAYDINLYYFEFHNHSAAGPGGITASYVTDSGTYTFSPVPVWSRKVTPSRSHPSADLVTPAGVTISSEGHITLRGRLEAANYTALKAKMDALEAAFAEDGTLNYGTFTHAVRTGGVEFGSCIPRSHVEYTIELMYYTSDLYRMSSKRSFGRTHRNPKVTEQPYCGRRRIRTFHTSAQEVSYSLSVQAESITKAREYLADEAAVLIVAGGIEMPGGTEDWDDDTNTISVTIKRLYDTAILANLEGMGVTASGL